MAYIEKGLPNKTHLEKCDGYSDVYFILSGSSSLDIQPEKQAQLVNRPLLAPMAVKWLKQMRPKRVTQKTV